MIIWLSSYPRSGNTLLRIILRNVFEQKTHSKHDDENDIGADQQTSEEVGHLFLGKTWLEAYPGMKESGESYFVKTHDEPDDDGKAIYIVRDGRSVVKSFFHYLKDFSETDGDYSIADVVAGYTPFGSWSGHLDAWNPHSRPNTLLIRYEDLLERPKEQIARIGEFIGKPAMHEWENNFDRLHEMNPKFFRAGKANQAETALAGEDDDAFWLHHAHWMAAMGYPVSKQITPLPAGYVRLISDRCRDGYLVHEQRRKEIRTSAGDMVYHELERLTSRNTRLQAEVDYLRYEHDKSQEQLWLYQRDLETMRSSRAVRLAWSLGLLARPQVLLEPHGGVAAPPSTDVTPPRPPSPPPPVEEEETDPMLLALRHLVEKGFRPRVVYDIGSAKGYWSEIVQYRFFRDADYYLIDPLKQNEEHLSELSRRSPKFHYLLLAIGSQAGTGSIYVPEDPHASSLLPMGDQSSVTRQRVEIETIDRLLEQGRLQPPDLVKLGVQGFEMEVLKGGQKMFDTAQVFIVRTNLYEFMPKAPLVDRIVTYLAEKGFRVFDIAGTLRRPYEDDLAQVNLVFVRNDSDLVSVNRWS